MEFQFMDNDQRPILTVTEKNEVTYKDRPLTNDELCEAMRLWLIMKGELPAWEYRRELEKLRAPDPLALPSDETEEMLQLFSFKHLPPELREISGRFKTMAAWMVINLPGNPQRKEGLQKLLEAKDCAVRARLWK